MRKPEADFATQEATETINAEKNSQYSAFIMLLKTSKLVAGTLLCTLSLFLAFISFAWSDRLNPYLSQFHGYSHQVALTLPQSNPASDDIQLIVPAFNHCAESCPANLMLSKQVLDNTFSGVGLVILSVQAERDVSALLTRYEKVTGHHPQLLDHQFPASWSLLARYEQIRQIHGKAPQHAGHLYVYHPASHTLLTYPSPDAEDIISDIQRFKTGFSHG